MPMKSKAQNGLMRAVLAGKSTKVPRKVAQEYVNAEHGKSVKKLPERVGKKGKK